MKNSLLSTSVLVVTTALVQPLDAATSFSGIGDFNSAVNWDDGDALTANDLPGANNGPGIVTGTATTSGDYLMANNSGPGDGGVTDIVVNGTLNLGHELQLRSGTVAQSSDLWVGAGTGNSGTLNVTTGGQVDIAGAATFLFVGVDGAPVGLGGSGFGTVNFEAGSTYQIQKGFTVENGIINFSLGMNFLTGAQNNFDIGSNGTLQFSGLTGGNAPTFSPSGADFDVSSGATLQLDFAGALAGESYTLVDSISNPGYNSFDNVVVNGLAPDQQAVVNYGTDTLSVSIVAIPEPSSTLLVGLAGVGLLIRRRK